MGWRWKLGKGMALVGAGCIAAAGLLALSADERPPSEVSAGVVAAEEPDPGEDDDKDRGKRESSTTSTSAEKDRAETTTSTRRRSQTSSSTSTSNSTSTTSKRSSTSTTATTERDSGSSRAASTTTTAAPASTSTQPATTSTSTTATTTQRAAGTEPSTTTTTAPSSVPTALITEPAKRGGPGGAPVGAAQSIGPDTESRGPRLPTASTAPRPPGAPAPVPSSAPAASPTTSASTAPAVTFESVSPNGVGGADLPPDQLQGAPGEVTNPAAPAVPTPAKARRPSGVLGMTGSATRTMLMMAGVVLLLAALIIAFGESMTRARGPLPGHTVAAAWGDSVPLAPSKREKARRRAGIGDR